MYDYFAFELLFVVQLSLTKNNNFYEMTFLKKESDLYCLLKNKKLCI